MSPSPMAVLPFFSKGPSEAEGDTIGRLRKQEGKARSEKGKWTTEVIKQ